MSSAKIIDTGGLRNTKMKYIKLTKNKRAFIDDEDFNLVKNIKWYADYHGYACNGSGGNVIRMHNLIMGKPPRGYVVDHINRKSSDNRKNNLRIVSFSHNILNQNQQGVSLMKSHWRIKRWRAYIVWKDKQINLGYYLTKREARTVFLAKKEEMFRNI